MKIITCASYYGTGSSAVTDLVSEYDDVKSLGDYEFSFLHEFDGVSDLEFHLVECPDRHASGHALKRFEKMAEFNAGTWFNKRYEPYFYGQYAKLTREYIDSLLEFKSKGYHFSDLLDRGRCFYYTQSILRKLLRKVHLNINPMPGCWLYYAQPTEERFLQCTRQYTSALLQVANPEQASVLMVDQLLPSTNINRCLRYLADEVYVFVVDRDPRDVYLANKYVWKVSQVPIAVEEFCQWFEHIHRAGQREQWDESRVMKLNFEDLIYKYEPTKRRIERFVGLSSEAHARPFAALNPRRSVVNTQLWRKMGDAEEVAVIENRLEPFLYDFTGCSPDNVAGVEPGSDKVF